MIEYIFETFLKEFILFALTALNLPVFYKQFLPFDPFSNDIRYENRIIYACLGRATLFK